MRSDSVAVATLRMSVRFVAVHLHEIVPVTRHRHQREVFMGRKHHSKHVHLHAHSNGNYGIFV